MKKLILSALFCVGAFFAAQAQTITSASTTQPTMSDYERMLQNQQKVEFRTQAIKALGLTEQQIKDFDPVYTDYMQAKSELAQRRIKLLNDYTKEIAENDSPRNEENDKEEFMEDYLELQVKETKLRKEYFDRLEDKITADKAFGFFLFEDIVSNDIYLHILKSRFAPFIIIEKDAQAPMNPSMNNSMTNKSATNSAGANTNRKTVDRKYRADVDAYSKWVQSNKSGEVGGHHQYTYDGLKGLTGAIGSLYMACGANEAAFATKKNKIMANAAEMQKDPKSMTHTQLARDAFMMSSELIQMLNQQCNMTASNSNAIAQLDAAARRLDASKTTTSQAQLFYDFFQKAQMVLDGMANSMTWSNQ